MIVELINIAKQNISKINLHMILNTKEYTKNYLDYEDKSISTEFFSALEVEELMNAAQQFGFYTTIYYDTYDFIKDVANKRLSIYDIVFDTTQKGIGHGKDALLPSLCDIIPIPHTGSNAVFNVISNDKYCWNKLLKAHNISVPNSWKYDAKYGGFITEKPIGNKKLICKPIYECASIGIDNKSVSILNLEYEKTLLKKSITYNQPLIVQELIKGYEVEVPIIVTENNNIILPPIGISINGIIDLDESILSFDDVYNDDYGFYDYSRYFPIRSKQLKEIVSKIIPLINVSGYARIDFRVDKHTGMYYVTDINSYPHIVRHSSFAKSFEILGFSEYDIIPALVGNALSIKF